MAKKPEDKPLDQSWMLTFCDCMTLLLCFFVLLLSFSSFDEVEFDTLRGAFHSMSYDWLEEDPDRPRASVVERQAPKDVPRQGPTIPTDKDEHDQPNQAPIEILDLDLYRDRTVFYLPSQRFFWGRGVSMTTDGKEYLTALSRLLRKLTCRIVIAESSGAVDRNLGLRRSWSILRYLTTQEDLAPDRFTVTAVGGSQQRFFGKSVLGISLMNIQVEE